MVFLSMFGKEFSKDDLMKVLGKTKADSESLLIMNDVAFMVESGLMKAFPISLDEIRNKCNGVDWRVDYMNKLYKKSFVN